MKMYADYIKEREGIDLIEFSHGFITYKINPAEYIYIVDIYVDKFQRKIGFASRMADVVAKIGKEHECKVMIGSVAENAQNKTESMKALLSYGFKFMKSQNNMLWFEKEIQ